MNRPHVTAVMPCLNEERTVGQCVAKAAACFARLGIQGEVLVADNGSSDRSVAVAQAAGARVVHVSTKGYGAAISAGVRAAQGDIIIMADSDESYDWSQLDQFIQAIEAGNDLVMGNRFRGGIEPGAMPPLHRYLGNPVLSFISRIAFRVPVGDFHCGMRAFTRAAFERMDLSLPGMEFATEMVASAARHGLRISEVPIKLYPDKRGRPPHLRSFRDGWRHLRFIISHCPDYVYIRPGGTMLLLGLVLMAVLVGGPLTIGTHYIGVHFMVLGAMLALIGANVISMGVLGKVLLAPNVPDNLGFDRVREIRPHALEITLAVSGALLLLGLVVDTALLVRWLNSSTGMEDTVHLAIAASTAIVIGLEAMFSAFLIFLAKTRMEPGRREAQDDEATQQNVLTSSKP
ncbi:glycosyltransferase [Pseudoduganella eburnea]|uniref:Glycosyltransferase n=1 Tax=Massilia eburnea TaxID=1776165 RepID=A0A6L6QBU6_9BURK|nr:glycosyltransferase family 2 protein [Massilia eburnea]MTW09589.1 glycosyltransferase [Massilia eburnea]